MTRKILLIAILSLMAAGSVTVAWVVRQTKNRVQIEFDIHINKEAVYLSTYAEPPQFAVWLENPEDGRCEPVFVTYRAGRGDWEGKAEVPVAIPRWAALFREAKQTKNDAVSGATPKEDCFRVRIEVRPHSEWVCWIEMNLAGDYNAHYPQFNRLTKEEDEFSCGQPALLYRAEVKATQGNEYTPQIAGMSLWEKGKNVLLPLDSTITSAQTVFDDIKIRMIAPKPVIIRSKGMKEVEQQDVLK